MEMEIDKEIASAHLSAAGWDLGAFNGHSPFECNFVYINDLASGSVLLVSVSQKDFESIVLPDVFSNSEFAHLISERIFKPVSGDEVFVPALVGYIKKTKAFGQWKLNAQKTRLHFFINIYTSKSDPTPRLRPFISASEDIIIKADDALGFSKFVHDCDQKKNPAWFS